MGNEVKESRRVFVLWGCIGSALGVVGTIDKLIFGTMDFVWFGLTGMSGFLVAMAVSIPAWFIMSGVGGGIVARYMFSTLLIMSGRTKRLRLEEQDGWMRVFFGLDQHGLRLR